MDPDATAPVADMDMAIEPTVPDSALSPPTDWVPETPEDASIADADMHWQHSADEVHDDFELYLKCLLLRVACAYGYISESVCEMELLRVSGHGQNRPSVQPREDVLNTWWHPSDVPPGQSPERSALGRLLCYLDSSSEDEA